MKYPNFLSVALIAVLMVVAVGCTTLQGAGGEYEERPTAGRRVIIDDPYYSNSTYLVRDPYTGMLYEVRPYGYSPYGNYYGSNSRYYNDRYYNNRYSRQGRSSSNSGNSQPSENVKKSRSSVLGSN
jgi:hypothetical protein